MPNIIPLLVSSLTNPYPIPPHIAHQPTHSCFPLLAFPYTRASSLLRTNGLSSHWCPTRPSSATYAAGAMGPSMCTFWLVVQSRGALGVLAGWHYCFPHGAAHPLTPSVPSPTPASGILQSNGWLWESASVLVRLWQSLSGGSHIRLFIECIHHTHMKNSVGSNLFTALDLMSLYVQK